MSERISTIERLIPSVNEPSTQETYDNSVCAKRSKVQSLLEKIKTISRNRHQSPKSEVGLVYKNLNPDIILNNAEPVLQLQIQLESWKNAAYPEPENVLVIVDFLTALQQFKYTLMAKEAALEILDSLETSWTETVTSLAEVIDPKDHKIQQIMEAMRVTYNFWKNENKELFNPNTQYSITTPTIKKRQRNVTAQDNLNIYEGSLSTK